MTTLERLKQYIEHLSERKPLTKRALSELGPPEEVDAALANLVAHGVL